MGSCVDATIEGCNGYIDGLREKLAKHSVYFSLIKFDSYGIRKLCVGAPIAEATKLDKDNYRPNGGTPLYDAIVETINATAGIVADDPDAKVVVVIQTDGGENASTVNSESTVKSLVEKYQGRGWEFVFIGADIDAYAPASRFGISMANTASYSKTATRSAFANVAANTASYSCGLSGSMGFTGAQKSDMGDPSWGQTASVDPLDVQVGGGILRSASLTPAVPISTTVTAVGGGGPDAVVSSGKLDLTTSAGAAS